MNKNRLNIFKCKYKNNNLALLGEVLPLKTYERRPWQQEYYQFCCETAPIRNSILNATTGSGKTIASCDVMYELLKQNDSLIALVAVPMKNIGLGFSEPFKIKIGNKIREWNIDEENDLCNDTSVSEDYKANRLIKKLKKRTSKRISKRVVLCSHATLGRMFTILKDYSILKNILLYLDEAHHSICDDNGGSNKIGEVVKHFIENEDKNLSIHLMTGTPFRADQYQIVPESFFKSANVYRLPYDRHFEENCRYLKQFQIDFLLYENEWFESIEELFNEKIVETIIFLPPVNSRYSTVSGKNSEVNKILDSIAGEENTKVEDDGIVLTVYKNGRAIRIVDLVDDSNLKNRDNRVKYIYKNPNDIDVILTLKVAGEGFNWDSAKREIIIGIKHSLTELLQMVGRTFRDDKSKANIPVEIIQVIPKIRKEDLDKDEAKEQLNNLLKAMYASLIFESIMQPKTYLPIEKKTGSNSNTEEIVQYFLDCMSEDKRIRLEKEINQSLIDFVDANKSILNKKQMKEETEKVVVEILKDYGVDKHQSEISKMFIKRGYDKTKRAIENLKKSLEGINISDIDVNLIHEIESCGPVGHILAFSNGVCGIETLRSFRERINSYVFLPFEEAREYVRSLGLKNVKEWNEYCKFNKEDNMPFAPNKVYLKEWTGWGDWLGTGNVSNKDKMFLSFEEARDYVRGLGLIDSEEWRKYCKSGNKPKNIPYDARNLYKDSGWVNMGDWLGTGYISTKDRTYRKFEEAREYVRGLKLKNENEWREYSKSEDKPADIPANPNTVYKNNGWINIGDWLGKGDIHSKNKEFKSFEECREFVRSLKLKSNKDWRKWSKSNKRPKDIPSSPESYYEEEWTNWPDFLGNGNISIKDIWEKFTIARDFVRKLELKNQKEWVEYCKSGDKPKNIPNTPSIVYEEWIDIGDWLGKGDIHSKNKEYRNFIEARKFVRNLKFKSRKEWSEYCKFGDKPKDIPNAPWIIKSYKKDWTSIGDWLGNGIITTKNRQYRSFSEFKKYLKSLEIKSGKEWHRYEDKPLHFPYHPDKVYKDEWNGWTDALGN